MKKLRYQQYVAMAYSLLHSFIASSPCHSLTPSICSLHTPFNLKLVHKTTIPTFSSLQRLRAAVDGEPQISTTPSLLAEEQPQLDKVLILIAFLLSLDFQKLWFVLLSLISLLAPSLFNDNVD